MSKRNKQNFRKKWRTLTELGQEFGLSAIQFGSLLKKHGLREINGEPTQLALDGEYVEKIAPKNSKHYFLWHSQKTSDYLVGLGIKKVGITSKEASMLTEARKLARTYLDAKALDDNGSKLGQLLFSEMIDEIKSVGLDNFNAALKSLGYDGDEISLDDITD